MIHLVYFWLCALFAARSVPQEHWTQVHLNTKNLCKDGAEPQIQGWKSSRSRAAPDQHLLLNWHQGMVPPLMQHLLPLFPWHSFIPPLISAVSQLEEPRWGNIHHICWGAILSQLLFPRWLSQSWSGSRGLRTTATESTWGQRDLGTSVLQHHTLQILKDFFSCMIKLLNSQELAINTEIQI